MSAVGSLINTSLNMAGIKDAGRLEEALVEVGRRFGDLEGKAISFADEMAARYGMSREVILRGTAEIAASFEQAGMEAGKATEYALKMGQAATVYARENPLEGLEAGYRNILGAIEGMTRRLKLQGMAWTEMDERMQAGKMFGRQVEYLTEYERKAVRAEIMARKLNVALGAGTGGENRLSGLWNQIGGRLENTLTRVGMMLLPAVETALGGVNQGMAWFEGAIEKAGSVAGEALGIIWQRLTDVYQGIDRALGVTDLLSTAWEYVQGVAASVGEIISALWNHWSDIAAIAGLRVREFGINLVEAAQWAGSGFGQFLMWFSEEWPNVFRDAFQAAWIFAENALTNIKNLVLGVWDMIQGKEFHFDFTPLLDGFKATTAKLPEIALPEFTSLQDDIDAVEQHMIDTAQGGAEKATETAKHKAEPIVGTAPPIRGTVARASVADFAKQLQDKISGTNYAQQSRDFLRDIRDDIRKGANKPAPPPPPAVAV